MSRPGVNRRNVPQTATADDPNRWLSSYQLEYTWKVRDEPIQKATNHVGSSATTQSQPPTSSASPHSSQSPSTAQSATLGSAQHMHYQICAKSMADSRTSQPPPPLSADAVAAGLYHTCPTCVNLPPNYIPPVSDRNHHHHNQHPHPHQHQLHYHHHPSSHPHFPHRHPSSFRPHRPKAAPTKPRLGRRVLSASAALGSHRSNSAHAGNPRNGVSNGQADSADDWESIVDDTTTSPRHGDGIHHRSSNSPAGLATTKPSHSSLDSTSKNSTDGRPTLIPVGPPHILPSQRPIHISDNRPPTSDSTPTASGSGGLFTHLQEYIAHNTTQIQTNVTLLDELNERMANNVKRLKQQQKTPLQSGPDQTQPYPSTSSAPRSHRPAPLSSMPTYRDTSPVMAPLTSTKVGKVDSQSANSRIREISKEAANTIRILKFALAPPMAQ
ncbi:hypothetical protein BJ085DRAFT_35343 [Dimargaris cristalligena]|uniref:Uncharacterized protein n=1 Tax=Dimargaris cristalligena TaxID=215637 RepID=A0A4P9ZSW9_9FUNG|nr:hypothetical protein BJ085DRAFT_35343 [Dimargaris cristalligena]|eukprot:RKP35590.1 hypothetical protein BJ085DRAFT_35343 [Dimargaris cristalligena]